MGDRVSISFSKSGEQSVTLFHHWGGSKFPQKALQYAKDLKAERGDSGFAPLDRLEPETVIVDFIRFITKDLKRVESSLYLGATPNDGDNSDNGHYVIDLDTLTIKQQKVEEP